MANATAQMLKRQRLIDADQEIHQGDKFFLVPQTSAQHSEHGDQTDGNHEQIYEMREIILGHKVPNENLRFVHSERIRHDKSTDIRNGDQGSVDGRLQAMLSAATASDQTTWQYADEKKYDENGS